MVSLAAISLFACDDDDDSPSNPTTADGGTAETGAGSSGTSGGGGTSSGSDPDGGAKCLDPATLNYVLAPRKTASNYVYHFYEATPNEPNQIFATTIDEVVRVDVDAKTVSTLYGPNGPLGATAPHHFLRASDVVVQDGKKLLSIPKAGGSPTALPSFTRGTAGSLAGTSEVYADGDTLYALESGDSGNVFKHDLATGAETVLGSEPKSSTSSIRLGPDAIYSYYANSDADNAPTTVWKLAKTGGAITPLAFTGAPSDILVPLGVVGTDLYLLAVVPSEYGAHVLRASTAGGAVTDLGSIGVSLGFKGVQEIFPTAKGIIVRNSSKLFWLPTGANALQPLYCFDGEYALYAPVVLGNTLYINVNTDNDEGGVAALPMP